MEKIEEREKLVASKKNIPKIFLENILGRLTNEFDRELEQDPLIINIWKAKKDIEQANNLFSNVSDPDLVDYASHRILADKSYYSYLLKRAREQKIKIK